MSGIINKLLDDYRHGGGEDLFPSDKVFRKTATEPIQPKVIKTKEDAEKAVKRKNPEISYKKTNNWGA